MYHDTGRSTTIWPLRHRTLASMPAFGLYNSIPGRVESKTRADSIAYTGYGLTSGVRDLLRFAEGDNANCRRASRSIREHESCVAL